MASQYHSQYRFPQSWHAVERRLSSRRYATDERRGRCQIVSCITPNNAPRARLSPFSFRRGFLFAVPVVFLFLFFVFLFVLVLLFFVILFVFVEFVVVTGNGAGCSRAGRCGNSHVSMAPLVSSLLGGGSVLTGTKYETRIKDATAKKLEARNHFPKLRIRASQSSLKSTASR